ncbi:hypothetical protein, partial [Neisseria sp. P0014.S009]|uniref:hypothetical protein n=1 Tax=unclassified Neisseria TaxID=2623750 RepID=UPI003F7CFC62
EGAHGKSPKCLGGNLGDFGEFCKGLSLYSQGGECRPFTFLKSEANSVTTNASKFKNQKAV